MYKPEQNLRQKKSKHTYPHKHTHSHSRTRWQPVCCASKTRRANAPMEAELPVGCRTPLMHTHTHAHRDAQTPPPSPHAPLRFRMRCLFYARASPPRALIVRAARGRSSARAHMRIADGYRCVRGCGLATNTNNRPATRQPIGQVRVCVSLASRELARVCVRCNQIESTTTTTLRRSDAQGCVRKIHYNSVKLLALACVSN